MVKQRGGLKRKIEIKKITKKESLAVACTKRCGGLFSKASQLCLLSNAQIAILATPPSSNSNVSFHSFGHSSVDALVSAFLSGKRPPLVPSKNNKDMMEDMGICLTQKSLGLGFWWEDAAFTMLQNPKELSDAVESMRNLLKNVKKSRSVDHLQLDLYDHDPKLKNKEMKQSDHLVSHHGIQEPEQALTLQSTTSCIPDGCLNKTKDAEFAFLNDHDDDLPAVLNDKTEEHDQILAMCESFFVSDEEAALPANDFEGFSNQLDMDLDQFVDQNINFDSRYLEDWIYELQGDGSFVLPTSLDQEIASAL